MLNSKKCAVWDFISRINPQYFCLAAVLGLDFLLMSLQSYGFYFMENYIIIPTMLFLGMAFGKPLSKSARRQFWLPLLMVGWFFITQTLHYSMDMEVRPVGLFTSVYCLAYLFASFTQDGSKQWGLAMTSMAYIGAALVLVLLSSMMAVGILPGFLKSRVFWDGARLSAMWQPNLCALIFMMGTALSLYNLVQAKQKWIKVLFLVAAVILFFFLALTNSRTAIIMCCCFIGGTLFFCIYNGSWRRFAIGAVAALAVIVLLFSFAHTIFQFNGDRLVAQYSQQPESEDASAVKVDSETGETTLVAVSGQGSLAENLTNFNNRTTIWKGSLQGAFENPRILLMGVDHSRPVLAQYIFFEPHHAHNSWLEVLLCLGLPGLMLVLAFTGIAIWNIWITVWGKNTTLAQKMIALLVLCLMGSGVLEPYLFFSTVYFHYTDFLFFLCLGYLIHWRAEAKK